MSAAQILLLVYFIPASTRNQDRTIAIHSLIADVKFVLCKAGSGASVDGSSDKPSELGSGRDDNENLLIYRSEKEKVHCVVLGDRIIKIRLCISEHTKQPTQNVCKPTKLNSLQIGIFKAPKT